jgi:predicted nucleic acid-binding protein
MKVLVDTSVWVQHFKQSNDELMSLLLADTVVSHPLVVGEIACGTPPTPRNGTLSDLASLEQSVTATHEETLFFIERHQLYGKGCGYIDLALLASTFLSTNCQLWTLDKRLNELSYAFGIAFKPT